MTHKWREQSRSYHLEGTGLVVELKSDGSFSIQDNSPSRGITGTSFEVFIQKLTELHAVSSDHEPNKKNR